MLQETSRGRKPFSKFFIPLPNNSNNVSEATTFFQSLAKWPENALHPNFVALVFEMNMTGRKVACHSALPESFVI